MNTSLPKNFGYIVPLICFVVVAYFGWRGYKTVDTVNFVFGEDPANATM